MAMLRNLGLRFRSLAPQIETLGWARSASSAPSVYDKIVEVTVIDKDGRRHAIRGVAGQNLAELLAAHVDTLGDDAVARSPEGRGAVEAHVKVPNEMFIKAPAPAGDDIAFLSELAGTGTIDAHSRLASRIVLDKDMQGSLVALAELNPWKTL